MKDKEKRITINREAGAMVDLLNQEIEELQKAKAIEEIAKEICSHCLEMTEEKVCPYANTEDEVGNEACFTERLHEAENVYKAGYRKIDKDSVVLSREEYEKLKSLYDCEQGSYMTSQIGNLPLTIEGLRKAVDEITRLIGVQTELQELNTKYYNEAKDLRRKLKEASKETAREDFELS